MSCEICSGIMQMIECSAMRFWTESSEVVFPACSYRIVPWEFFLNHQKHCIYFTHKNFQIQALFTWLILCLKTWNHGFNENMLYFYSHLLTALWYIPICHFLLEGLSCSRHFRAAHVNCHVQFPPGKSCLNCLPNPQCNVNACMCFKTAPHSQFEYCETTANFIHFCLRWLVLRLTQCCLSCLVWKVVPHRIILTMKVSNTSPSRIAGCAD